MNIITVIPLTRSKVESELSYFTAASVPIGAIVSVPLRSKSIHAIVTDVTPAENQKSSIKKSSFIIKKLNRIKTTMFFPIEFIESSKQIANYYATTVGAVIRSLIASHILENAHMIAAPMPRQDSILMPSVPTNEINSLKQGIYAVQGDDIDRVGSWRSAIRQEFAKKKSMAIFTPTIEEAKNLFEKLEKGIEGYIFILHSALTEKKFIETWQKISDTDHPVIVIATSSFVLLPRDDIDIVIIERENGRDWISRKSPYIDGRYAIEYIARKRGQTVFLADSILRTETLYRLSQHEIFEGSPFKWRSITTARDISVDMRRPRSSMLSTANDQNPNKNIKNIFRIFSIQLENLIEENLAQNTHMFIYNTRRGFSPSTVCNDCESVVICKQCSAPVVLYLSKESGRNFFMCHKCGDRRSADETCACCGSWNLSPLGIGTDRIASEIRNKYVGMEIFQIDAENSKSTKNIEDTIEKFWSRPGSILIGTEMAIPYLGDKIDHIAIVSLDSLLSLPDYRINEKIMHIITRLRSMSTRSILLQTRMPTEKVFEYAMKGNLSDFHRYILLDRQTFKYPPYSVLIKISIEGKKDAISLLMSEIQDRFVSYTIDIFPAFTSTVKGNSTIHGLIKVDKNAWPDPDL
ncbi:MAG: hypothetical protein WCK03_03465, partial [Candidatus Taylorbacteria bacterium]